MSLEMIVPPPAPPTLAEQDTPKVCGIVDRQMATSISSTRSFILNLVSGVPGSINSDGTIDVIKSKAELAKLGITYSDPAPGQSPRLTPEQIAKDLAAYQVQQSPTVMRYPDGSELNVWSACKLEEKLTR